VGACVGGGFSILGHNWPLYFGFKGGKGVLTSFAVMLALAPLAAVCALLVFILVVAIWRYVSLGSVMGVMLYPIIQFAFYPQHGWITLSAILIMILIVFMHRENIKRLMAGKESKISLGSKKKEEKKADASDDQEQN
jgi:glycerol-3-phosphate acyltransferase PlsY